MATTIIIPSQLSFSSLGSIIRPVIREDGYPSDNQFIFDFSNLRWVEGPGLTVLSNTLEWLYHHGARVEFANFDRPTAGSISYLDDCGFFDRHLGKKLNPYSRPRSTTLPFMRVDEERSHEWLENRFTPFMCYVLNVQSGALASIRSCVGEVFNNIADHSTLNMGFVHVQHYPNMNSVRVSVSDFGRGIPNTIRDRVPELSDMQAILKATQEGVTAQTTPRNRGLGLDLLIRRVTANNGVVTIFSYSGVLTCYVASDGTVYRAPSKGNAPYPGTLVDISLRTDQFVGDDYKEQEIEW